MTMIFTAYFGKMIVSTVDSAVTRDVHTVDSAETREFQNHREYVTERKSYFYPGVGCVATWGERVGNTYNRYLDEQDISPERHSVDDLASLVEEYLRCDYRPEDYGLGEVGYHIAGFDRYGQPHLHHVFWGFDRPRPCHQKAPDYRHHICSSRPDQFHFLYNGRNDLAQVVVDTFLGEIRKGGDTRYSFVKCIQNLVSFADFVARFAGEITPEVGPPFLTRLIWEDNTCEQFCNDSFTPLSQDEVIQKYRSHRSSQQ